MSKLKVGMISFAHSNHPDRYFKELTDHPDVELTAIADEDKSRVQKHLDVHPIPYYSDYRELLKTDCDAVLICSEYIYHARMTIDAAKAGKHILLEKPLALTMRDMREMIAVCRKYGVQLMTAFPCRYISAIVEAKAAVERGEIGNIIALKGTNRGANPGGWFNDAAISGGGALMDHTTHMMDLMNWFTGASVQEVYAEAGKLFYDLDVEDAGMVHVKFDNGVVGVIDTSWSRVKALPLSFDVTLNIIGTKGTLSIDALAQRNELFNEDGPTGQWSYWGDSMDKALIGDFVRAVREGRGVPITGEDGMRSTEVALAAYESVRTGNPVPMSLFREQ